MGFPSPASEYVETRTLFDQSLISQPSTTYFPRALRSHFKEGILHSALLDVDASLPAFLLVDVMLLFKQTGFEGIDNDVDSQPATTRNHTFGTIHRR